MTSAASSRGLAAGPTGDELSIDEVAAVLASLPRMSTIRLGGGEPFGRKDFWQIEALARRHLRPSALYVATDGVFTDRIVKFCDKRDKALPLRLEITADPARRSSAWAESMQTARILARYTEQFRLRLAITQIVATGEDTRHYERLRLWLQPFGVTYRLQPQGQDALAVPPSSAAPEGYVRLLPNGDLLACHCGGGRVGNLRTESFAEVWYSDAARRKRDLAERCPGCWGTAVDADDELLRALA